MESISSFCDPEPEMKAAQKLRESNPRRNLRVAIIGAGCGGLAAAKALKHADCFTTVFDSAKTVGGVWASEANYPTAAVQFAGHLYQFPDFANKFGTTAPELRRYFEAYVKHFELGPIRLNTKVLGITPHEDGDGMTVEYVSLITEEKQSEVFDKVVVATGLNSRPRVPDWAEEAWRPQSLGSGARVLHSSQVRKSDIAEARSVIVVGASKSAMDIATMAPSKTVVVARSRHDWMAKALTHLPWFDWMLPRWFGRPYVEKVMKDPTGKGFKRSLLNWINRSFLPDAPRKLAPSVVAPKMPAPALEDSINGGGFNVTMSSEDIKATKLLKGVIMVQPTGFTPNGRGLTWSPVEGESPGEDELALLNDADLIVFATGYDAQAPVKALMPWVNWGRAQGGDTSDGLYFYRNLLHPSTPDVAYIGLGHESFFTPLIRSAEALWVASLWTNRMLSQDVLAVVNDPTKQEAAIQERVKLVRSLIKPSHHRAALGFIVLDELDGPFFDQLYADIYGSARAVPKPWFLGFSWTPLRKQAAAPILAEAALYASRE